MQSIKLPPKTVDIELSMFKDAFSRTPTNVKLGKFLEAVASGSWATQVQGLRDLLSRGERGRYDDKKRSLPAVTLSGTFQDRTTLIRHSGLLQGDIDKLPRPQDVRDALGKDPHTLAAFLSPSGEGIKALFRIPADRSRHLESFKAARRYYKELYGLELDQACKDINRLCFVSLDPEIRTNPSADVLDLERWTPPREEEPKTETRWNPPGNNPTGGERPIRWGSTDWRAVFESAGMSLGLRGSRIIVLCPFRESHTTNPDGGSYLFPGKEGSWGWTCLHSHCQNRTLKDVAEALWEHVLKHSEPFEPCPSKVNTRTEEADPNKPEDWPDPIPLPDHHDLPPKLDPNVLPEPLAEFCRAAALENETAPEAAAGFLLSALGISTGTRFAINPDPLKPNWFEYTVRSVSLVMPVSTNKTGVFRAGLNPLERIQIKIDADFRNDLMNHTTESELFLARRKGLLRRLESPKLTDEERNQTVSQLKILDEKTPQPPTKQVVIMNKATPEKLLQLAGNGNERGILLKADELVGLIAQTERPGNEGLREFYIEALTVARYVSGHTIGRGSEYAETLALAFAGCVQPSKLRRLLREMERGFKDDGLLQRFIWIWPDPPSFESFEEALRSGSRGISAALSQRVQTLFERLETLTPEAIGAKKTEFAPAPWVGFDEEAQQVWRTWRHELRRNIIHEEELPEGFVSWLGKSERLVSGLALTFHVVECAQGRQDPGAVGSSELERAIDVWDVLRHHARRVFELNQTGTLEAAHLLVARLGNLAPRFNLRELKQKHWKGLRDDETLQDALDWLVENGSLKELVPARKPHGGRPPSRMFLVNPKTVKDL